MRYRGLGSSLMRHLADVYRRKEMGHLRSLQRESACAACFGDDGGDDGLSLDRDVKVRLGYESGYLCLGESLSLTLT